MSVVARRLTQGVVAIYLIVSLSFVFHRLTLDRQIDTVQRQIFANPERYGLPLTPTQRLIDRLTAELLPLAPNQPVYRQYGEYLVAVFVRGDFGESIAISPGRDVAALVFQLAPATAFLSAVAITYFLTLVVVFGAVLASLEGIRPGTGRSDTAVWNQPIPYLVIGTALVALTGVQFRRDPANGGSPPRPDSGLAIDWVLGAFAGASGPALSLVVVGGVTLILVTGMRAVHPSLVEHTTAPWFRGRSTEWKAMARLLYPATVPIWTWTVLGLGIVLMLVAVETSFEFHGMGLLFVEATIGDDMPVAIGGMTIVLISTVIAAAGVDLAEHAAVMAITDPETSRATGADDR